MKKIMIIGKLPCNSDLGQAEIIRTRFIIRGLEEKGHQLSVFSYYIDKNTPAGKHEDCKTVSYMLSYRRKLRFLNPIVYTFLFFKTVLSQAAHYDCILCDKLPHYYVLPFLLAVKLRRKKYIIQYNEFLKGTSILDTFKKKVYFNIGKFFDLLILKSASVLIVISSEHRKYYQKYTSSKCKHVVISMLMEIAPGTKEPEKKPKDTELVVGYAGTLNKSNGVELLLSAVSEAIKQNQKVRLTIFGPARQDYRNHLNDCIKKAGLENKITILNPLGNQEAIAFIQDHIDILVIPKLDDDRARGYIPSKLGDYLYSGKPLIVTDVGEMNQYIQHQKNGFIVSSESPEPLTRIISFICENYEISQKIGLEGRLSARQFDYKKQITPLSCLIDSL